MTKTQIFLQAINDVKDFVTIVMRYDFDIDLLTFQSRLSWTLTLTTLRIS